MKFKSFVGCRWNSFLSISTEQIVNTGAKCVSIRLPVQNGKYLKMWEMLEQLAQRLTFALKYENLLTFRCRLRWKVKNSMLCASTWNECETIVENNRWVIVRAMRALYYENRDLHFVDYSLRHFIFVSIAFRRCCFLFLFLAKLTQERYAWRNSTKHIEIHMIFLFISFVLFRFFGHFFFFFFPLRFFVFLVRIENNIFACVLCCFVLFGFANEIRFVYVHVRRVAWTKYIMICEIDSVASRKRKRTKKATAFQKQTGT